MFIKVKYGDKKYELFNLNCSVINLLDNIKRRCRYAKDILIDLSDKDGVIQKISEKCHENANCVLKEREEYILLKVEKSSEDDTCTYTPLLNHLEYDNPDLLAKLQNISKPEDEQTKQSNCTTRKKSAWEKVATGRKFASKVKESGTGRTTNETGRDNSRAKGEERYGNGAVGERKTVKQKKSVSVKT